ncbi:MAG: hypothetical protein LCI02_21825 [Proteobacteria bacterium]|nr:hypothetical protein [Pseudomonadota bacterium]
MKFYCYQHPEAAPYYRTFKQEPSLPVPTMLSVTAAEAWTDMTLSKLLRTIVASSERDIGIVCHGEGSGLEIPLVPGANTLFLDQALVSFKELFVKTTSLERAAELLKIAVPTLRELMQLFEKVRAKRFGRLELRACSVGSLDGEGRALALRAIRELLACESVCAPQTLNFYAWSPVQIAKSEKDWEGWLKRVIKPALLDGPRGRRFGLDYTASGRSIKFMAMADSLEVARTWAGTKLPGGSYEKGNLSLHGMLQGGNLIFPLDKQYLKLLTRVP